MSTDESKHPKILTLAEAAKVLRIHRSTVSRYAKTGELKRHVIGSRLLFKESDVYEFFENRAAKKSVSGQGKEA